MKILCDSQEGIYIEKKSKFICHLYKVKSAEEVQDILKAEKKKYYDAKHHCYAYVLGNDGSEIKYSDDGEPSQTAGKPMLDILQKEGITNILCVVIRYFGGTLLGTGGLVRAYSEALKDAMLNSTFKNEVEALIVSFNYSYNFDAKINSYLRDKKISFLQNDYSDSVSIKIVMPVEDFCSIREDLVNITNGSVGISEPEKCMFAL